MYWIGAVRVQQLIGMGFLDNLENSLKSLEKADERDPTSNERRTSERARALAVAPWAEKLKTSDYTKQLFDKAAIAGHRMRMKIYMAWLDGDLRLEARQRRLELKPTSEGIIADFVEPNGESKSEAVDLNGDPQALLDSWLGHASEWQENR